MPVTLLQPVAGSTVTTPVLVEWLPEDGHNVTNFGDGYTAWIAIQPSDYSCDYSCAMWVDWATTGSTRINVLSTNGSTGFVGFSVSGIDDTGGDQELTPDPNLDPDLGTGTGGGTITVDMTAVVEQLEDLNAQQLIIEQQNDFLSTAVLAGLFMFSCFFGYKTGMTR